MTYSCKRCFYQGACLWHSCWLRRFLFVALSITVAFLLRYGWMRKIMGVK